MLSIGIDIGRYSVKVAEAVYTAKDFYIRKFEEFHLSQDPSKDNKLEVIEILRKIAETHDPQTTRYVFAVDDSQATVHRLFLPFRERHKILKSLAGELEDEVPLDLFDVILDARVTHFLEDNPQILAVACAKDHIENFLEFTNDSQLQASVLSVKSLALANTFETQRETPLEYVSAEEYMANNESDVVLNFGHDRTELLLLKDGYLLDSRSFDWGGRNVAEAIGTQFNLHYVEALKELKGKGFVLTHPEGATQDQIKLSETIKKSFDGIAHQIQLTLLSLKSEYGVNWAQIRICGGLSGIKNLGTHLTTRLEIPVNKIKDLSHLPNVNLEQSANNEIASMTAIGLAIEGTKRPKNPAINLLKDEFAVQSKAFKIFIEKWGYSLSILAACFCVLFVHSVLRDSFSESMTELSDDAFRSQAKKIAGAKGGRIKRQVKTYIKSKKQDAKVQAMLESLNGVSSALDVMNDITNATPRRRQAKYNVKKLLISNDRIVIEGEADNSKSISSLQNGLRTLSSNGKVDKIQTQYSAKAGWRPFGFSLMIQRRAGEK